MQTLRDGTFSSTISGEELARGLRPSKREGRNKKYLVTCAGGVGQDRIMQVLEDIEDNRIDTSVITDDFPYPQIFILTNHILVCGETTIYSYSAGSLTLELGGLSAGNTWDLVDFYDFIYMSNGVVAVKRDPTTSTFSITSSYPAFLAACNNNGQVIIGGPSE